MALSLAAFSSSCAVESSHYIGADDGGEKPYRLLADAMAKTKRAAYGGVLSHPWQRTARAYSAIPKRPDDARALTTPTRCATSAKFRKVKTPNSPNRSSLSAISRQNDSVTVADIIFSRLALGRFRQQLSRTLPVWLARSCFAFQRWQESNIPVGAIPQLLGWK
jgi:hypothetical protein